jgi:hypothetical protein
MAKPSNLKAHCKVDLKLQLRVAAKLERRRITERTSNVTDAGTAKSPAHRLSYNVAITGGEACGVDAQDLNNVSYASGSADKESVR